MIKKTCAGCKHFKVSEYVKPFGDCAMTGDYNDGLPDESKACGWDMESYVAGVYVGPKFGCIHWVKRSQK